MTRRISRMLWTVLAFFLLFFYTTGSVPVAVRAEEDAPTYSDVLTDLQKDATFDAQAYPGDPTDYSLKVIQIAESVNNELMVYVYQPSAGTKDLTATTIRLSMPSVGADATWQDYALTLLNATGVFQKYKVEGVTVSEETVRYYDITTIHRAFDSAIDSEAETTVNQTTNEVAFEVAQLWTLQTNEDGSLSCFMKTTEVVFVTGKVVGFVRYFDSAPLNQYRKYTDSHFVAFSTDKKMEDLLEADISYVTQVYSEDVAGTDYGNKESISLQSIEKKQVGSNSGEGLFAKKYEWNRIEETSSFLQKNDGNITYTQGGENDIRNQEWIVRFCETDYIDYSKYGFDVWNKGTKVSEVTILRLKFITDGKTYNLGVIDNKTTGSDDPFAGADTVIDDIVDAMKEAGCTAVQSIISLVLVVLICYVLIKILIWAFKKIFNNGK